MPERAPPPSEGDATGYREILPHPALRRYVDRLWFRGGPRAATAERSIRIGASERETEGEAIHRVLPDGRLDVIVSLGTRPQATIVGTMTRPHLVPSSANVCLAAVRFQPGGAASFLGPCIDDFTDAHVDVTDAGVTWLVERALDAGRAHATGDDTVHGELLRAVRAIEAALLDRLTRVIAPDPLVAFAARALWVDAPPTVDALARRIGWTRQHLRRTFAAHVGLGPKTFGRVARMQRALTRLQGAEREALAVQAVTLGYFDQAHMARDFRELCGVAPSTAARARGSIFPMPRPFDAACSSP